MTASLLFEKISTSTEETETIGAHLAQMLCIDSALPAFIALYGDLGVGKTAFTRGVASVISPYALVRSPTFTLVNEYRATAGGRFSAIFHFDLYRIDSEDELDSIGFWDYLMRNGLILTEWSEKISTALPDDYIRLTIVKSSHGENFRTVTAERIRI